MLGGWGQVVEFGVERGLMTSTTCPQKFWCFSICGQVAVDVFFHHDASRLQPVHSHPPGLLFLFALSVSFVVQSLLRNATEGVPYSLTLGPAMWGGCGQVVKFGVE